MRAFFVSLAFFPLFSNAAEEVLQIGESTYQPSCGSIEWPAIDARLRAAANGHFPDELAGLARTYVCLSGEQAQRRLVRHMPEPVQWVVSGSAEADASQWLLADAIDPRAGAAWGLDVHDRGSDVSIVFFVDEACAHEVRFRPREGNWQLAQLVDACD